MRTANGSDHRGRRRQYVRTLAIDGGKSHSAVALFVDGERCAEGRGPGLAHIAEPDAEQAIAASLMRALAALRDGGGVAFAAPGSDAAEVPDAVCLGLTGVQAPSENATRVLEIVRRVTGARTACVTSDVVTTFCGSLGLGPGAVVAAGTGAIALGVSADGVTGRVDGWGYLLDDAGSGFQIGQRGLRSALRQIDGRGGSPALARLATERFGPVFRLTSAIYGADRPPETVASFARAVAEAAHGGDPEARAIWRDAGIALADCVSAAWRGVAGDTPGRISWNGGLFAAGDLLRSAFGERLADVLPGGRLVPPSGDALDGARLLAETPTGHPLQGLLQR